MIAEINLSDQYVRPPFHEPTQKIHALALKQPPSQHEKDDISTGKFANNFQSKALQHVLLQLDEPTQEIHASTLKQLSQQYGHNDINAGKSVDDFQNNTSQHITKVHTPRSSFKQLCMPLFQPFTAQNKKNRIIKKLLNLYHQGYTPDSKKTRRILNVLDRFSRYVVNNLGPAFIRCQKIRAISKELFDMLLAIDHISATGQQSGEAAAALRQSEGYRMLLELAGGNILVERLRTLLETSPGRIETIRKIIRFLGRLCRSSEIKNFIQKALLMIEQFEQKLANDTSITSYQSIPRAYARKHPYVSPEMRQRTKAALRPLPQRFARSHKREMLQPVVPQLRHVSN